MVQTQKNDLIKFEGLLLADGTIITAEQLYNMKPGDVMKIKFQNHSKFIGVRIERIIKEWFGIHIFFKDGDETVNIYQGYEWNKFHPIYGLKVVLQINNAKLVWDIESIYPY